MRKTINPDFERVWLKNKDNDVYARYKAMKDKLGLSNRNIEEIMGYKYGSLNVVTAPSNNRFPRSLLFALTMFEYCESLQSVPENGTLCKK
jgi:hypothetical protein